LAGLTVPDKGTVPPRPDRVMGSLAGNPLGAQVNAVLAAAEAMRNLSGVSLPPHRYRRRRRTVLSTPRSAVDVHRRESA
jgi:hypothetical protein